MKISVLIPCYNAGKTIEATLASVFAQTMQPDEILVLNDGSTDDTLARLEKYKDRVVMLSQKNSGVACARNRLVQSACGDVLAFLDSDDIWHEQYLEAQWSILQKHPEVVASFTGHFNFPNNGVPDWIEVSVHSKQEPVIYDPVSFLLAYNTTTGLFASMSYCCIRTSVLETIPGEPFHPDAILAEDSYLCYRLALRGAVARLPMPLVAYRLTTGSISSNLLVLLEHWVRAFELLQADYACEASPELLRAFARGFAAKRRQFARTLLGAEKGGEARRQLRLSLQNCFDPKSVAKSLVLLLLALAPKRLQPHWPSSERVVIHAEQRTGINKPMLSSK